VQRETLPKPQECVCCHRQIQAGEEAFVKRIILAIMPGNPTVEELMRQPATLVAICLACAEKEGA
jgi:hypothetical protein